MANINELILDILTEWNPGMIPNRVTIGNFGKPNMATPISQPVNIYKNTYSLANRQRPVQDNSYSGENRLRALGGVNPVKATVLGAGPARDQSVTGQMKVSNISNYARTF